MDSAKDCSFGNSNVGLQTVKKTNISATRMQKNCYFLLLVYGHFNCAKDCYTVFCNSYVNRQTAKKNVIFCNSY
jgi:hypothetical protein